MFTTFAFYFFKASIALPNKDYLEPGSHNAFEMKSENCESNLLFSKI